MSESKAALVSAGFHLLLLRMRIGFIYWPNKHYTGEEFDLVRMGQSDSKKYHKHIKCTLQLADFDSLYDSLFIKFVIRLAV